jgi:hypothetical protein
VIETLETCIRTGNFGPLRDLYDADSRLEAFLPSETIVREGSDEIIGQFTEWWPSEGTLVHWRATSYETGLELLFERHPVDDERPWTSRHWQEIHIVEGRIARHLIWSDKPRHVGELEPLPDRIATLVEGGDRTPLFEGGYSGSRLERIAMPNGARYVMKHISPRRDVLLRATNDSGREATLYTSGVLERVADVLDYPVVAVAAEGDGWAILLRDVSDSLLGAGDEDHPPRGPVTTDERRTILSAVGRLHDAFRGERIDAACTVTDRLRMLGPALMATEASGQDAVTRWVRGSWEVFFDITPADVADAVAAIHADPASLADQLMAEGSTLIHGDLWAPNIGLAPGRVILLDWALACQAPAEMEYAFWVLWNCGFMNTTPDRLMKDVRTVAGERVGERRMLLSFLGEFVSGAGARGWAWNSVNHVDPKRRRREREELDWWVDRARDALDRVWSPV